MKTMKPTPCFLAALLQSLPPTGTDLNLSLEGNGSWGPCLPCPLAGWSAYSDPSNTTAFSGAGTGIASHFFPSFLSPHLVQVEAS